MPPSLRPAKIALHHDLDEPIETHRRLPAQLGPSLRRRAADARVVERPERPRLRIAPVNGTSATVFRLMSDS